MSAAVSILGDTFSQSPMRKAFLKWQCRVRQNAMRDNEGRPDAGIMPSLILPDSKEAFGHIITVLNKSSEYSVTPELRHMLAKTHDPAQRREQAIRFFSATYYQRAAEFSDVLTATFKPGSVGAARILEKGQVELMFDAYARRFCLSCRAVKLEQPSPLLAATMAHNMLFNPALDPNSEVIGFEPDWDLSSSNQEYR